MTDRDIILCVTGGIAAYKAAALASRLRQDGASVTVAMTNAAQKLVTPHTFEGVTGNPVATTLWPEPGLYRLDHISLADRADMVVVAPATANIIAKAAAGIADDLVSTTLVTLGADRPVVIAPAMNNRMWANPIVQRNVRTLKDLGWHIVEPAEGWLACGEKGPGRMAEPDDIRAAIETTLQ